MAFKPKLVFFFATGFYSGYIPVAPGTFGSVMALPLCYLLSRFDKIPAIVLTTLFIGGAIWVSHQAERLLNSKDPGCVVIDEIAGMMVTLLGLPFDLFGVVCGFLIFRIFDIIKFFPIRWFEQKLTGGLGIVLDDVAAGILANCCLRLIFF